MQNHLITLSFFISCVAIEATDNLSTFDPMDVFELEWATDPQVSQDGEKIVYVRRSNDIMQDDQISHLWQVSIDGRDHRILTSGLDNPKSPRWSPDNSKLAFIADHEDKDQIFMRWMDTGETGVISKFCLLYTSPSPRDCT